LANIVSDMDSLYVEIDNLNEPLVGFCFIISIDRPNFERNAGGLDVVKSYQVNKTF
jgi:hypothetical protein